MFDDCVLYNLCVDPNIKKENDPNPSLKDLLTLIRLVQFYLLYFSTETINADLDHVPIILKKVTIFMCFTFRCMGMQGNIKSKSRHITIRENRRGKRLRNLDLLR